MRLNWIYVLCLILSLPAFAANHGYRVHSSSQTLIQIARDIYKDERMWKEIAYLNNIKPPYLLSVGQVLVLKTPPAVQSKNLVTGPEVGTIKPLSRWPSVERKLLKSGDDFIYIVNERAPSLAMVARELYGDVNMAAKIASWGGLESTSRLSLGQRLRLKVPPTKTAAQGNEILIANWAARGNDMMVDRLEQISTSVRGPATTAKNQVQQAKAKPKANNMNCTCNCNCNGGCNGSGNGPAAQGFAAPSAGAPSGERLPQSVPADEIPLLNKNEHSPDVIPAAHKTEVYWLGDEAKRRIQVIETKVPSQ